MENVPQAVYFQRKWSDNKIGNAYLKELLYCFWKDKFWKVTGRTKPLGDTTNFTRLKEAFFGQFGKPTREVKNEKRGAGTADVYIWDGNVSQIELHHLKSSWDSANYGFFKIQSVEIEKERGKPKGLGF